MSLIFGMGRVGTVGSGASPSSTSPASTFTTSLSPLGGQPNTVASYVVTPGPGGFPGGKTVQPNVTGFGTPSAQTTTAGSTTPLVFSLPVTGAAGTNAIVNVEIDGMTNATGAEQFAVAQAYVPPTPTKNANRFDVRLNASAAAPGSAVPGSINANGLWAGGAVTLTPSNGDPAITVALPSSGSASVAFSYTPSSAGFVRLVPTNTANLANPYPAALQVFTGSSGTARTISAQLALFDLAVHQRDTPSGVPSGFSTSWAKGWGEVWLTLSALSGATDGIWVRLYDALSSGATSSVGTGTALTGAIQVCGPVSAAGEITALLPAGPYVYFADVATDAAMTNPVRLSRRFKVGHVTGVLQRSYEDGLCRSYAYGTSFTGPYPACTKAATLVAYDRRYGFNADPSFWPNGMPSWFAHDGVNADTYQYHGEGPSTGTMEYGRLVEATLGVCVGLAGISDSGGGLDGFVNHDGSLNGGLSGPFATTVLLATRKKFRDLIVTMSNWDGVDSAYPTENFAESMGRLTAMVPWIAANFPTCAVQSICNGASGWFGNDGSAAIGYVRYQVGILALEAGNPMVASRSNFVWNERHDHSSMGSRIGFVQSGWHQYLMAEVAAWGGLQVPTDQRGATFTGSGTVVGRVLRLPIKFNGTTGLAGVKCTGSDPARTYTTPSAAEQASMFGVYAAGGYAGNGQAIKLSGAVLNTSSPPSGADATMDLTLAGTSGVTFITRNQDGSFTETAGAMPSGFAVAFGDFYTSGQAIGPSFLQNGQTAAIFFADSYADGLVPFGRELRPAVDMPVS